jgi:hypothetical protein
MAWSNVDRTPTTDELRQLTWILHRLIDSDKPNES